MNDERKIIITDKGINVEGKWKIGELLAAAQALTNTVNEFEISSTPQKTQDAVNTKPAE